MKKLLAIIAIALIAALAYLLAWPVPIDPVAWDAPKAPGYTGPHAVNNRLAAMKVIPLGAEEGPEHIAFGRDGKLYTTVLSGNILRMNADGSGQEVFVSTGGRVLGFDFDAQGNLIAADAVKGLLAIAPDRRITTLADKVTIGGRDDPIRYADAAVVAKNGRIYLSDASARFAPKDWGGTFEASVLDILEQAASGRVLEYDPATKNVRIVARGLAFPNGLALSQDEKSLFVSETGKYRVWQVAVDAKDLDVAVPQGQARVLLDNLPGYPDNLMRAPDGKIWAGLVKPRNPKIDDMAGKPWMRKLTLRLPRALWPIPQAYSHAFAFTEDGKVVTDLQDPSGAYPEVTAVTETADRLYFQSLHAKGIGWLPK